MPFEGIAFAVAHQPVEGDALVGLDLGFLLFRAVLAVIASAGQLGDEPDRSPPQAIVVAGQCCDIVRRSRLKIGFIFIAVAF